MITVVGFTYMINDWEERLSSQLKRIKVSKLYDNADELFLIVTDTSNEQEEKIKFLLNEYPKFVLKYFTHNWFEAHALSFIDELAREDKDRKILYFHTKGVFNKYKDFNSYELHDLKINGIKNWVEILEYFLIDRWDECIEKLNTNDTVGVTNSGKWWWGNFWWTTSDHIKKNIPFKSFFSGSRWSCEAWLHESNTDVNNIKFFEFFHFSFHPYYTILPKYFYDGTDLSDLEINVIDAKYGYFAQQTDEGRNLDSSVDLVCDVTDIIKSSVKKENYKNFKFNIPSIINEDPAQGLLKSLRIVYSTNIDPKNVYTLTTFPHFDNINLLNK
jgi:hypothetical protein